MHFYGLNYNKRLYKYLSLNCWLTLRNSIKMYGIKNVNISISLSSLNTGASQVRVSDITAIPELSLLRT